MLNSLFVSQVNATQFGRRTMPFIRSLLTFFLATASKDMQNFDNLNGNGNGNGNGNILRVCNIINLIFNC